MGDPWLDSRRHLGSRGSRDPVPRSMRRSPGTRPLTFKMICVARRPSRPGVTGLDFSLLRSGPASWTSLPERPGPDLPRLHADHCAGGRSPSARSASSALWVAIRSAAAVSRATAARATNTARAVSSSRLPVGSSASSTAGRLAIARAIATRCCSPPDRRAGRWSSRSARPERAQQLARARLGSGTVGAGQHLRQHDVLERARTPAADDGTDRRSPGARAGSACARRPTAGRTPGRRRTPRRRPGARAGRRSAAASTCPSRTVRPAPSPGRAPGPARRRAAPRARRRPGGSAARSRQPQARLIVRATRLASAAAAHAAAHHDQASFIAQRFDRIEPRRAPGRIEGRQQRQHQTHRARR